MQFDVRSDVKFVHFGDDSQNMHPLVNMVKCRYSVFLMTYMHRVGLAKSNFRDFYFEMNVFAYVYQFNKRHSGILSVLNSYKHTTV